MRGISSLEPSGTNRDKHTEDKLPNRVGVTSKCTATVTVTGIAVARTSSVRSCCNCLSTTPGMYPIWLSIEAKDVEEREGRIELLILVI
jgi:hypothetical protein